MEQTVKEQLADSDHIASILQNASNDAKALAQHCISTEDMIRIEQLVQNLVRHKENGQKVYNGLLFEAIQELDDEDDDMMEHIVPKLGESNLMYSSRLSQMFAMAIVSGKLRDSIVRIS